MIEHNAEPEFELEVLQLTVTDPGKEPQEIHDFIMEMSEIHNVSLDDVNKLLSQCAVKARVDYAEYDEDDDTEFDEDYADLIEGQGYDDEEE